MRNPILQNVKKLRKEQTMPIWFVNNPSIKADSPLAPGGRGSSRWRAKRALRMRVRGLDGSVHGKEEVQAYDHQRQAILEAMGYRVVHYTNRDVLHNLDGVVQSLLENLTLTLKGKGSPILPLLEG